MKCKLCGNSCVPSRIKNQQTKKIAYDMKVCGKCQRIIKESKNYSNGDKIHVLKCHICKCDCDRYSTIPTCQKTECRAKYYRNLKETETIENCIENNNFNPIKGFRIKQITALGFAVEVKQQDR